MKALSDTLQFLLDLPGIFGYLSCMVLVVLSVQIARFTSFLFTLMRWVRSRLIRPSAKNLALFAAISFPVFFYRAQLSDGVQWIEQRYIDPRYIQPDTSARAVAAYEYELARHVDPNELEVIKQRTRETAARIGSTPLAIYEVAYSECGLHPFRIRKDGIAAGWIQFTTAGLKGLGASLEDVKVACGRRDIEFIMSLTDRYLVDRAKGAALPRSVDVYTCIFAPGHIDKPDDFPLYQGWANPEYYMNMGLDGYYLKGCQIFRSRAACDGKITKNDLNLVLQSKKSQLL